MSIELLEAIDEICERFEELLLRDEPAQLENFVASTWSKVDQEKLIYQLLKIDLEYQIRRGDCPSLPTLQARFPDFPDVVVSAIDSLRRIDASSQQPEESPSASGFGNYELLEMIGAGGMGQVYKAKHRWMDRIVAVKLLPHDVSSDAAAIQRFEREIKAAAKLTHPNIVVAFDADETPNGLHFLVMEYIEGSDLSQLSQSTADLPIATVIDYVLQAARGLEYVHSQGIVHRDIKPSNLLLDQNGTVKVVDLGLANFLDAARSIGSSEPTALAAGGVPNRESVDSQIKSPEASAYGSRLLNDVPFEPDTVSSHQTSLTRASNILGSVDYMAPEQAIRSSHVDARADIYSLGCTLYRLLTKKLVYEADTAVAKLKAHQSTPIPKLRLFRPDASGRLEAIFEKMVAKRPEDRFQSMAEVITDLEAIRAFTDTSRCEPTALAAGGARSSQSSSLAPGFAGERVGVRGQIGKRFTTTTLGAAALCFTSFGYWATTKDKADSKVVQQHTSVVDKPKSTEIVVRKPKQSLLSTTFWPFDPNDGQEYEWSEPENLGPIVNNPNKQLIATFSGDEFCLVIEEMDINTSIRSLREFHRSSLDVPWESVGKPIESTMESLLPALSSDGLSLYVVSKFMDGVQLESREIFVRTRPDRDAPWGAPERLPPAIGSNSSRPCVSPDGLSLVFNSTRPGGFGLDDLYIAHRKTVFDPWGEATNLGEGINDTKPQFGGPFIGDRTHLLFSEEPTFPEKVAKATVDGTWTVVAELKPNHEIGTTWPSFDGRTIYFNMAVPGQNKDGEDEDIYFIRRVPKKKP